MANIRTTASISRKLRLFGAAARGVAGIEFAIIGPLLALGLVNAVDVGYYAYQRMEVENAAEAVAQAAWKNCNNLTTTMLPATINCPGLNDAINTAIKSTSLPRPPTLASGTGAINPNPGEGYYCVNSSNVLQYQGSVSSPPTACSSGVTPGDYLQVQVTYPYTPLFPGLISVMSSIKNVTPITKTTWMRMG
ncbi:MAG: pilus assembly protein [Pseudomonadota bacterium]|nr:pilus assembly protein [Pseudomonadota bacterium]